jgi:hypothetical protein
MNEALLMIIKHCKPSSKELLTLKSSDLCVDYEANRLIVAFLKRQSVISDGSAIFNITQYQRN